MMAAVKNQLLPFDNLAVKTTGTHERPTANSLVWLTPPFIIKALGEFDLDPCAAPEPRPWPTAETHWTRKDGSLMRQWFGRVWLNPPYGQRASIAPWMKRLAEHGRGTALIFARTETQVFFKTVWESASAVLFLRGRLAFHLPDGTLPFNGDSSGTATAPSVLVAYGADDAKRLGASRLDGQFLWLPAARKAMEASLMKD